LDVPNLDSEVIGCRSHGEIGLRVPLK
jgi:hypothetical protein